MKVLSGASTNPLPSGVTVVDGRMYMPYLRNESGVRKWLTPATRNAFRVDIEPWGDYMSHDPLADGFSGGLHFERGILSFRNPLVVDFNDWKDSLSIANGGKRGKDLSKALEGRGYDCILAQDQNGEIAEVVALNGAQRFQYARNQVFFHGTNQSFDEFDSTQLGSSTNHPSSKNGFFFTDDPLCAHAYALNACKRMVSDRLYYEAECDRLREAAEAAERRAQRTGDWSAHEAAYQAYEDFELSGIREDEGTGACIYPVHLDLGRIFPVFMEDEAEAVIKNGLEHYQTVAKEHGFDSVVYVNSLDVPGDDRAAIRPSNHIAVFDANRIRPVFQPEMASMPKIIRYPALQESTATVSTGPAF